MNRTLKNFLYRGLMFGGFGPIIAGIIFLFQPHVGADGLFGGAEIFTAILSTYFLAFIHAGASVFNQIEKWSIARSTLCHLGVLYAAYTVCYLLNSWIPFDPRIILVYTLCFIALYFVIWFSVFSVIKINEKKLNSKIK